ncbi:MAG: type VII toxin-antitoxin system MntA family adenylyltransferase antitoxin [Nitrospiraceae bacterium]
MVSHINDNALIEFIRKAIPDLIALYRFGSQANGTVRPDSDVDIAALARHPIPALRRFELAQKLAAQLHRDVDLVDLRTASTVMRMQVISTGACLFTASDRLQGEFEDLVYSDYARLNEERREILNDVRTRGSIYAG